MTVDPLNDPNYHWNGQQWLWWNGQAWIEIGVGEEVEPESPKKPQKRIAVQKQIPTLKSDRCDRRIDVVGSEYYTEPSKLRGPTSEARLVREPNNRYDKNAIRVMFETRSKGYVQVGHISRFYAERYAPLIDHIGGQLQVVGKVENGYGYVYLPSPQDMELALWECQPEESRGPKPLVKTDINLANQKYCQKAISKAVNDVKRDFPGVEVPGTFRIRIASKGKYKDLPYLECLVGGEQVGTVPAPRAESYPQILDAGESGFPCTVRIHWMANDSKWHAKAFVRI